MSINNEQIVTLRIAKSEESLKMAEFAIQNNYWNSAASELYYTCFYLITALFAKHDILAHTHSGVNTLFARHFIKEEKIDRKWGKLFSNLLDMRQDGDYGDLVLMTQDEIVPLVKK
ncbi:MAG: hypothetical protein JWQ09_1732 [Segetibacter sp.]|nr:hypothetical protein [Segetibacter sp.]